MSKADRRVSKKQELIESMDEDGSHFVTVEVDGELRKRRATITNGVLEELSD